MTVVPAFHVARASLVIALVLDTMASQGAEFGGGEKNFGSKEAAELVAKARTKRDRDEAAELYARAIALQPGAPINAHLAATIARAYAHYADKKRGIRTNPAKAALWWQRAIECSNPRLFVWAEAQANLGCALFLMGDPGAAAERFQAVLDIDPEAMELPPWKQRPSPDSPAARKALADIRRRAAKARIKAVDNVHYVLKRLGGTETARALAGIARDYQGSPVGDHARQILAQAVETPGTTLYDYHGMSRALSQEIADLVAQEPRGVSRSVDRAPSPARPRATGIDPTAAHSRAEAQDTGPEPTSWWAGRGVVLGCLLAAMLVIISVLLARGRIRKGDRG
jgi:tetratricopeptide (TPR) repeat protein